MYRSQFVINCAQTLLGLCVFLLGVLFLELIGGIVFGVRVPSVVTHERLHHRRPHEVLQFSTLYEDDRRDIRFIAKYNALGWLEEAEVARVKPPGEFRVFYVGDSFIEGVVPPAETVPAHIERALNESCDGGGIRYEVINAGSLSYSPLLEYILIRYVIMPYAPDLIVLNVDMTDDFDDWKYRHTLVEDEAGAPYAVRPSAPYERPFFETDSAVVPMSLLHRAHLFLYQHSNLYFGLLGGVNNHATSVAKKVRYTKQELERLHRDGIYQRWAWCQHEWDWFTARNVGFTTGLIKQIAEVAERHGVALLVTGVPHRQQLMRDGSGERIWSLRPHREIADAAHAGGARYFDSVQGLESKMQGAVEKYYYPRDMHFNREGNALWAEVHREAILSSGVLPSDCRYGGPR